MAFQKGISGNPKGRTPGNTPAARLRQQIAEALPEILNVLVEQARNGDTASAKLLLDRALPALKPQVEPVMFTIADNDTLASTAQVIVDCISRGEIPADTGTQIMGALSSQSKIIESTELIKRIEALENASIKNQS